jgi:hypothetical protein
MRASLEGTLKQIEEVGLNPDELRETFKKTREPQGSIEVVGNDEFSKKRAKKSENAFIAGGGNEPQGEVKQPERKQPAQRPQEGQLDNSQQQPEAKQETLKANAEVKKNDETQAALDELYKEHPKESIFKTKPQGTEQREHFLEAQAHKEGKFQHPHEIENDPAFIEGFNKLSDKGKEVVREAADAITNKKKVYSEFYQPKTKTENGVLTKRSGFKEELYSPKGLVLNKDGSISIKGYNENSEMSTRDPERFTGEFKKTTESGYEGLYKHPSDINNEQTFHPADAIVEQVSNPILKKQAQGKPIVESDYRQAYQNLRASFSELRPELQTKETMKSILNRLPDPVKEYMQGGC